MNGAPGAVAACGGAVGAAAERRERCELGVMGDGGYMSADGRAGGGGRGGVRNVTSDRRWAGEMGATEMTRRGFYTRRCGHCPQATRGSHRRVGPPFHGGRGTRVSEKPGRGTRAAVGRESAQIRQIGAQVLGPTLSISGTSPPCGRSRHPSERHARCASVARESCTYLAGLRCHLSP